MRATLESYLPAWEPRAQPAFGVPSEATPASYADLAQSPDLTAAPLHALGPSQLRQLRATLGDPVFAGDRFLVWELL